MFVVLFVFKRIGMLETNTLKICFAGDVVVPYIVVGEMGTRCSETFAAGLSKVVKSAADHTALLLFRQQSAQSPPQGLHISGAVRCLPFELN